MGIKHQAVKASGDMGLASEWNDEHVIDSDVDMAQSSWENQVIENLAAPPAGPAAGQMYFDTTLGEFRVWDGAAWLTYVGIDTTQFIRHDGSVAFTANQSMGTHKLTDVTDPAAAQDAATKNYVDGKVSFIKESTGYWSAPGIQFVAKEDGSDNLYVRGDTNATLAEVGTGLGSISATTDVRFFCGVNIPHGAVVTGAIVNGSDATETWYLYRIDRTNPATSSIMAQANIGTEDVTITNPTIDNSAYAYFLSTSSFESGNQIYGARITYTYP